MSCRDDLPVARERWQRFRRALRTKAQPAKDVLIGLVIGAATRGSPRATAS